MDDETIALLRERGPTVLIEQAELAPDRLAAVRKLHQCAKRLYWKEKDLPGCLTLLAAGIRLGLNCAEDDPARLTEIRGAAKAMSYDTASFTWPGWDEPGIEITERDMAAGVDAARTNLRLAEELNRGDVPLARAHWMLGAQLLGFHPRTEAIDHFRRAEEHAATAGSRPESLLGAGFAALAELLDRPQDPEALARLEAIKTDLAPLHDGAFYVSQIETAARVYGSI